MSTPAFVVARLSIKDKEQLQTYSAGAAKTIADHGGQVAKRGAFVDTLLGAPQPHMATAVLQFPSVEAARTWFASDAYQALAQVRDEACDMQLSLYEAPAA